MRGKKREIATKLLDELAGQMNPQQIEESRRLRSKPNPELGQTEGNEPYVIGMGVTSPVILIDPKPTYTEQARRVRAEGIVLAQCIVRKDGTVGSCKILRELGFGLDESAVSTISARWRFKPAFFQAKPVDCLVLIETSFRLY
jgi:TonB family protein